MYASGESFIDVWMHLMILPYILKLLDSVGLSLVVAIGSLLISSTAAVTGVSASGGFISCTLANCSPLSTSIFGDVDSGSVALSCGGFASTVSVTFSVTGEGEETSTKGVESFVSLFSSTELITFPFKRFVTTALNL